MQFTYRIGALAIIICLTFFIHALIKNNSSDTEVEDRILRLIASLETEVGENEAALRYFRSELVLMREKGAEGKSPSNVQSRIRLKTMNIYNALPYLLDYEDSLAPALTIGKGRQSVSIVIGIPTVKRPTQSYLLPTLQNLLSSMLPSEKNETLIIIFIAETEIAFVQNTVNAITRQFKEDVDSGLIEICAPSPNYYPDFKTMRGNLGDSEDRTRWRTKQNLDYAYLMMYAQDRGTYYVQLEDDVLTKKGFVPTMKNFALQNTLKKAEWFLLDFCQLGFIGKMFRGSDLWRLIDFFLLFYRDKPGDWLLSHFFTVKYCKLDYSHKRCVKELNRHWIHYKPSLFQHIGMVSSLHGKVQKLKDRQFGKLELYTKHDNPAAKVESTLKHYGKFSLDRAYQGRSYFWGLVPEAGDTIKFTFDPHVSLKKYRFISGNAEHPSDKLYNATFEVETGKGANISEDKPFPKTKDGLYIIDEFDDLGVLDGNFPDFLNPIAQVRITLRKSSENWVILSEIYFEQT